MDKSNKDAASIDKLISFSEIMKIVKMSCMAEAEGIQLSNLPWENNTYNVFEENDALIIMSSDGRKLRIKLTFDSICLDSQIEYKTKLSLAYTYKRKLLHLVSVVSNDYAYELNDSDLIKSLSPVSSTGNYLSWRHAFERKDILFTNSELSFVSASYQAAIEEEQARQKLAEEIKQKVLTLPTSEMKNIFNGLKGTKKD